MALGTGVNVSKAEGCALLAFNPGANVSKAEGCALLVQLSVAAPVWDGSLSFASPGFVGIVYSQSGTWVTAGSPPITYTLHSGSLPAGLSLSSSGLVGTLAGTPTTAATYTFTLLATNAYGSAVSQSFTIVIDATTLTGGAWTWIG
jgi:hypothetical protein